MTRPLRIEVPNGIHHAISRGIYRQDLFFEEGDFRRFLLDLQHCIVRFNWICLAYCLMRNHFHLLIQTPDANLGVGMRDLKSGYARGLNARLNTPGPRFDGRYKATLVQDHAYLLAVARYIALNPVRAGLFTDPTDYEWSSYGRLVAGEATRVCDPRNLLSRLSDEAGRSRADFMDLVADGAGLPVLDDKPIFGDAAFVAKYAPRVRPEQPVSQGAWAQARPSLEALRERQPAKEAMREARGVHHYTLSQIAAAFGCSVSTVRRAVA